MSFALFNNSPSWVILVLSSAVTDLPNKTLIFHDFQGPTIKFHDFPGLENEILKFHGFPGFPWPVQTRLYTIIDSTYTTRKYCYCCKKLHCSFNLNSNRELTNWTFLYIWSGSRNFLITKWKFHHLSSVKPQKKENGRHGFEQPFFW